MDFRLPELGEGIYEAELIAWLVKPGDVVKRGQGLMEALTDKATMEVPAPFAGTVTALKAESGQTIKVGEVVLSYESKAPADGGPEMKSKAEAKGRRVEKAAAAEVVSPLARAAGPNAAEKVKAAPSVRQMARKLGVDLSGVRGSGPEGRILIEDLTPHLQLGERDHVTHGAPLTTSPTVHHVTHGAPLDLGEPGTRIRLQGLRRKIAEHMVLAKRTIPHYSYVDECDATELVRLRQSLREKFERGGVKLTYLAFFVKAAAQALQEVPLVNSTLDENAGEIVLHDHYHVGIAVATPGGLLVPVVRDADQKDLIQVARDIDRLSAEARSGKARLDDLRGGTFTITSIGGIGGLISTPVINHPEVGILGVGKVVRRPVYDAAGGLRPADLVYLSFSFDHRVVDGAVGATFGNAVIRQLQNPTALLLPEKLA